MSIDQPQGVLFDLDGTLVDSEPLHRRVFVDWLTARGWPTDEETIHLFTGRRAGDVFVAEPGPWTGHDPAALVAEIFAAFPDDPRPDPMPGAAQLVRQAAARMPIGLVTSAPHGWVDICLGTVLGVRELFAAVVTEADVRDGKPDPAGYVTGCLRLDRDPSLIWAVEDSPAGVLAAAQAGIGRVYGITSSFPADVLRDAGATRVISRLDQVGADLG